MISALLGSVTYRLSVYWAVIRLEWHNESIYRFPHYWEGTPCSPGSLFQICNLVTFVCVLLLSQPSRAYPSSHLRYITCKYPARNCTRIQTHSQTHKSTCTTHKTHLQWLCITNYAQISQRSLHHAPATDKTPARGRLRLKFRQFNWYTWTH